MDVAASEFKVEGEDCYDLGKWYPESERGDPRLEMTGEQFAEFYCELCKDFPIITIEDPVDQGDWTAWTAFTAKTGEATQVAGDDLTVTNATRVKTAITDKACNALLLKVNQIGSMTESIDAVKMCKQSGWGDIAELAGNSGASMTMPVPCFNVVNGGSHAGNKLAFQEYFIILVGAETFK